MYDTFKVLPEYKQSILAHFKKTCKIIPWSECTFSAGWFNFNTVTRQPRDSQKWVIYGIPG